MPEAHSAYTAPTARVPRTLFQHAHRDGSSTFPANIWADQGECFLHFPDNWNGLDALKLWFFATSTEANMTINVTVNIGTCSELFNVHTQTVNAIDLDVVQNKYTCIDITVAFATVLANLAANDMMWIIVAHASGDTQEYFIGAEAQET